MKTENQTRLTLDLPTAEVEKLREAAKADDRTVASFLRHVVRKTLENDGVFLVAPNGR